MLAPTDPILMGAGLLLLGLVATQALRGLAAISQQRSRERQRANSDADSLRRDIESAALAARARLDRGLAWEGRRLLRVSAIIDECPGVKSFYLTDPQGGSLASYLPGQYLTLSLPIASLSAPTLRCYSLSDRPHADYYRITVKRQESPADEPTAPPGRASAWLHDAVSVGDTLLCEAPRGTFFLDPSSDRPAALLGAGVGVTPLMSMLSAARHASRKSPLFASFAFRDGSQRLFRETLDQVLQEPRNVRLRIAYTRPRTEDRLGADYHLRGRLGIDALRRELPSNNFDFYLCGPAAWMQSIVPELLDWGVPDDRIHYEAFGPASVATGAAATAAERALGSAVRFGVDSPACEWDGAYATLLDLAEARGVPVASGCRAGNCGACRVRVVEGAVSTLKRPGASVGDGECLACISVPRGAVRIET
jgi:ferredoxin-NADP reductase